MFDIIKWTNENSGFLTLLLFLLTLLFGWITGIFKNLRHRPNFELNIIAVPTFCCTFKTGKKYKSYDSNITAFAIYLKIKNTGSASAEIEKIQIGYHNYSFKYKFFWFWLDSTISLKDFAYQVGESFHFYPFLIQTSNILPQTSSLYLKSGQSTNGIVYFEQSESYGSYVPKENKGKVKVKIRVFDVYNNIHSKTFWIPIVNLEYAKKFNEKFGQTLEEINRNETVQ